MPERKPTYPQLLGDSRVEYDQLEQCPTNLLTRQAVFDLSRHNPVVYACLISWHQGTVTFEQALIAMVGALAEQSAAPILPLTSQL